MAVLLITRSDDNDSVALVEEAVRRRGVAAIRLNSDLYPEQVRVSTWLDGHGESRRLVDENGRHFNLDGVTALWYRRFGAGGSLPEELGDLREACLGESGQTLYGMIAALGCFELDPLAAVRRADHKELQLQRARACGLEVPATLISNDPEEVRTFFHSIDGRVVTKMQSSFAVYRPRGELVVFTTPVRALDLNDLSGLRWCPMTFQEQLDKRIELRVTVVGLRVFAASIDSQRSRMARTDWRRDGEGLIDKWQPYQLPADVERSLLALMREFGLNYGAADFVVTPDGRHVFLEINACGEWFWLQQQPGLPIADAIADLLTGRSEPNRRPDAAAEPPWAGQPPRSVPPKSPTTPREPDPTGVSGNGFQSIGLRRATT